MNASRRIFLFRDLPTMGISAHLTLLDSSASVYQQGFLAGIGRQTYLETYRFGDNFLVTETDYIISPKKLAVLRTQIFNHP